jgi:hypothetical protein
LYPGIGGEHQLQAHQCRVVHLKRDILGQQHGQI